MLKKAVVAAAAAVAVVLVLAAGPALGNTISPNPADLGDLDHNYFYTWGINLGIPAPGYFIDSASLFIDNIYDWEAEANDILYVHLLDNPPANAGVPSSRVTVGTDNENHTDAFAGIPLFTYTDTNGGLPSEDILYTFTAADLVTLNQYWANNGVFGFGFDPDCHYYNDGITFTYTVDPVPVPEPASLALLGIGLGGLALRRRFYA